ncbi:uncharacterized protein K441DRAFT_654939 [Cenococcum geophilum 1.58]|uniref:uncharacterized protein n=1 Tax=Cenococcum geophilum 1.58 TaxID=794803 RepID=UPI00358EDDB2|nr:hypothetical protein K441DRAFT_654939 [Cenococcum geophilum 1.58]
MSLSFPILPDSLDLPRGIPSSSTSLAGMCIGDLGWGPRKRHLVLTRPAVPLGRNHAASRRTIGVCMHVYRVFEWEQGQDYINSTVITNSTGSMVRMADRAR